MEHFYHTLKEASVQTIQISLDLSNNEIDGFLSPHPVHEEMFRIILFEKAEGGVSILKSLTNQNRFKEMVQKALEILHKYDSDDQRCQIACYSCLLTFFNQRVHHLINRNLVLPLFEKMSNVEIIAVGKEEPVEVNIDGLLEKCVSNLEREILKKIHYMRLRIPDEAQKVIYDKDKPVAKTDFFFKPNIVLFVDEPDHEKNYVKEEEERKRNMGYRVYAVKSADEIENYKEIIQK